MIIWTIKAKVMAFILTVCVSVSCVTGFISYTSSKNALQDLALTKLTAVRSAKSSELNIYLRNVKAEIQTLSENRMTIEAMREFNTAFKTSSRHLGDLGGYEMLNKTGGLLSDYYLKDFIPANHARDRLSTTSLHCSQPVAAWSKSGACRSGGRKRIQSNTQEISRGFGKLSEKI